MEKEKRDQLLKLIEKEKDLKNICTILDLSELEVMGEINRLKSKGQNISVVKKVDGIYVKNNGDNSLENTVPYIIETRGRNIKIVLISDTRLCSIYQQLTIVNDVYRKAYEFGANIILHCGDISEGVYSNSQALYADTLFAHDVFGQSNYIVNSYPCVEDLKTYFITGEHDHTHLKQSKKDCGVPIDIGNKISDSRDDLIYLGKNRRTIQFVDDNGIKVFDLLMQHPKGRIPYTISYKPQQFISSIRSEDKPDILVHGHWLQTERLRFREIEEYSVPSLVATTPEMKDRGDQNTIGAWFLDIDLDNKNNIKKIRPLFIPYYETISEDYKNVRRLVLGGK